MQEQLKKLTGGKEITDLSQEERRSVFQKMRAQMGGAAGGGGRPGGAAAPGPGRAAQAAIRGFTRQQRQNATLPAPPEEGSDVDILLRPGLLADAEVTVQEMNDVLYVPYQALFDTPQGDVVYLWRNDRLEAKKVTVGARSESQVVITAGLEEGDMISLEPPEGEGRSQQQQKRKKSGGKSSAPGGGFGGPGGGGGGRRGGGGR